MRRNLVLFAIMWALVLLLVASCATKNGRLFFGGGWIGPSVSDVAFNPAGPYYAGGMVTFSVTASATNADPGVLTYSWSVDNVGSVVSGAGTNSIDVTLGAAGSPSGSVTVRETIGTGDFKETTKTFSIEILEPLNAPPVISSLTYSAPTITAAFSDADGDDLTVSWSATEGTVTPVASDNTSATATFAAPSGSGTAVVTFSVTDGIATASQDIDIAFAFDPWEGASEDSIFLIAPASAPAAEEFFVYVYAWPSATKPVAQVNSVRILLNQSDASLRSMQANDMVRPFGGDGGSFFDPFWDTVEDAWMPDLLALLPPPQEATGFTLGANWGWKPGQTPAEISARGAMFAFALRRATAGTVNVGIDPADTFYIDLASTQHTFATVGKDYGAGVSASVNVAVS